jgi:hypothetical protein
LKERKVGYCIRHVRGASSSPVASLRLAGAYRITVGHENGDVCVIDFHTRRATRVASISSASAAAAHAATTSGKKKKSRHRKEAARVNRRRGGGGAASSNRRHLRDLKALCNSGSAKYIEGLQFEMEYE